jgi:hypothetical protein
MSCGVVERANVDGARLKFVRKLQLLLGYPWLETLANAGWY